MGASWRISGGGGWKWPYAAGGREAGREAGKEAGREEEREAEKERRTFRVGEQWDTMVMGLWDDDD